VAFIVCSGVIVISFLFLVFFFYLDEPLNLISDPRWFDINAVTGVLKLYFRELQEPLLTFALFDPLIACCSKS